MTSSTRIGGEPVRHAESGTPPADPQSQNLHLTKPQDDSCAHSSVRSTRRTVEVLSLKYFERGKPSGLVIKPVEKLLNLPLRFLNTGISS